MMGGHMGGYNHKISILAQRSSGHKQRTPPAGRHSNAATRGPALSGVKSHLKAPLGAF